MAFTDLLHFAIVVELYEFHPMRIFEISDGRIVEGKMPIFSNPEAAKIDRLALEQMTVASAFIQRQDGISLDIPENFGRDDALDTLAHVIAKCRFVGRGQAKVLIHVEKRHFEPINSFKADELFEEPHLGIPSGQNASGLSVFSQNLL